MKTKKQDKAADHYEVLVGMNYGPDQRRAEPGDVVDDLPEGSLGWLLEQRCIRKTDAPLKRREKYDDFVFGEIQETR